jgi:nitroreductase / dihydropteridine reductase
MNLIEQLNWRYAVKRMTGEQIPEAKLDNILEAIRLSASSMGLQPYTILVISNREILQQIRENISRQPQVAEASHLLVFAVWNPITDVQIDDYINNVMAVRKVSAESLEGYRNSIKKLVHGRNEQENQNWAAKQAYLALGTGLAAAAMEEIDATPMEGFDPEKLDELLQLPAKGLKSVVLLALGYRDEASDYLVNAAKVRRKKDKLFIRIN